MEQSHACGFPVILDLWKDPDPALVDASDPHGQLEDEVLTPACLCTCVRVSAAGPAGNGLSPEQ